MGSGAPTYTPAENARVFSAAYHLTEDLLARGISAIFDATNLAERHRTILHDIATRQGARFFLIGVVAPRRLVRERLESRQGNPANLSDADWRVFREMEGAQEKTKLRHFVVNTAKDIQPVVERIVEAVTGKAAGRNAHATRPAFSGQPREGETGEQRRP